MLCKVSGDTGAGCYTSIFIKKSVMRISAFCLLTCVAVSLLLQWPLSAAESMGGTGGYRSAVLSARVPKVLAQLQGFTVTGEDFLQEIARGINPVDAPDFPSLRPLPRTMIWLVLMDKVCREKKILVSRESLEGAYRRLLEEHKGRENLLRRLGPQRGMADVLRGLTLKVLEDALATSYGMKLDDPTKLGIKHDDPQALGRKLYSMYNPRWFSTAESAVLASIAGRDYIRADLAPFVYAQADDAELQAYFDRMLRVRILLHEAKLMGVYRAGMTLQEVMWALWTPLLQETPLLGWARAHRPEFSVYQLRLPKREEFAGGTQEQAAEFAQKVKDGKASISGRQLFLCPEPLITGASPEAYGLDYVYNPRTGMQVTPLLPLRPDWKTTVMRGKLSEVLKPLRLPGGKGAFTVARLEKVRVPRDDKMLLDVLRQIRVQRQTQHLLRSVLQSPQTKIFWRAADRLQLPDFMQVGDGQNPATDVNEFNRAPGQ